jgi:5-methylcytosine-specific restriction protein B
VWSDKLLKAVGQRGYSADWPSKMKDAVKELFGSPGGRYSSNAEKVITVRAPELSTSDDVVPFAALIHPSNPNSGPYGGMSIAIFPGHDSPCLLSFVVGTNGLAPDDSILGRPGHARKVKAICAWLNKKYARGEICAWAKQDPSKIDEPVPATIVNQFPAYSAVFKRYGNVLYAVAAPKGAGSYTLEALAAFLDLMFEERGELPLASSREDSEKIKQAWLEFLTPDAPEAATLALLNERRYVVLKDLREQAKLAWHSR